MLQQQTLIPTRRNPHEQADRLTADAALASAAAVVHAGRGTTFGLDRRLLGAELRAAARATTAGQLR